MRRRPPDRRRQDRYGLACSAMMPVVGIPANIARGARRAEMAVDAAADTRRAIRAAETADTANDARRAGEVAGGTRRTGGQQKEVAVRGRGAKTRSVDATAGSRGAGSGRGSSRPEPIAEGCPDGQTVFAGHGVETSLGGRQRFLKVRGCTSIARKAVGSRTSKAWRSRMARLRCHPFASSNLVTPRLICC